MAAGKRRQQFYIPCTAEHCCGWGFLLLLLSSFVILLLPSLYAWGLTFCLLRIPVGRRGGGGDAALPLPAFVCRRWRVGHGAGRTVAGRVLLCLHTCSLSVDVGVLSRYYSCTTTTTYSTFFTLPATYLYHYSISTISLSSESFWRLHHASADGGAADDVVGGKANATPVTRPWWCTANNRFRASGVAFSPSSFLPWRGASTCGVLPAANDNGTYMLLPAPPPPTSLSRRRRRHVPARAATFTRSAIYPPYFCYWRRTEERTTRAQRLPLPLYCLAFCCRAACHLPPATVLVWLIFDRGSCWFGSLLSNISRSFPTLHAANDYVRILVGSGYLFYSYNVCLSACMSSLVIYLIISSPARRACFFIIVCARPWFGLLTTRARHAHGSMPHRQVTRALYPPGSARA